MAAPRDAVIAVEAGTYRESLQPLRPVTVVVRCARQVVLESPGGNTPASACAAKR
ncbi:MAG: hypothetical protein HY901_04825 [Deltaproteobacteria bacterium]|nr:hypothetical protein [Deltaproteobacteria bacterium]